MLSSRSFWFWAKLGVETWPEKYHPVICHLIDVGQVARALWRVQRSPIRKQITSQLGLENNENAAGRWLAFWIGAHDIGKVTPCFQFQGKTDELKRRLGTACFNVGTGNKHHSDTGTKILRDELVIGGVGWPKLDGGVANRVAVAVGGHHGVFRTNWDMITGELGDQHWAAARREILQELARRFEIANLPAPSLTDNGDQSVWMYFAGLTSVADWIGSNVEFFPPVGNKNTPDEGIKLDEYFLQSGEAASKALDTLGWCGRPQATGKAVSFSAATGISTPRGLQEKIISLAQEMKKPQLIIVEAPMGEGKTEAAWYVARCWDDYGGAGTYVALPTMATSNQMFDRVQKFLGTEGEGKKNLMLQHGKASLNDRFAKLKYAAWVYDEEKQPAAVVAEGWFAANKKHGLLAPYGVGTIDQALLAVLQTKHVFVRLFGLAGKCVILDEVHAYDAYMTTLMERLLRWLAALGCPVVLLSATLPVDKRTKLLKAYAGDDTPEPESVAYPRVTSVAPGEKPRVTHVEADPKRAKTIRLKWVEDRDLVGKVMESVANGGCAAVIRNTVGLAQKTYECLRDAVKGSDIVVELFHARFPFGRRKTIEDAVLAKYGKGPDGNAANPIRPKKAILVATQVIEQSLDLDFDVMFTDVAPVDLVLQRAGRLHRHERGERGDAELWLIEPEKDQNAVPKFGDSEYVYARFVLLKSFIAIRDRNTVKLPGDLERLVEQIYGNETPAVDKDYADALANSKQEMLEEQRVQRVMAKSVTIYRPDDEDLLNQPSAQLQEDDPEAHRKIQAATRDTEPTIQLIVVYRHNEHDFLDLACTDLFDSTQTPDVQRLRRLLDNEVTISNRGCVFHYVTQAVPAGWRASGMLRHHRLLRVDLAGHSLTDEWIRLDAELGVVIRRKREMEGK